MENMAEEYHYGRLHGMKYLGVIDCHVHGVLMNSRSTWFPNRPVFESLEELYLERVSGLEELCVGVLPPSSVSNLKLLNVRNLSELVGKWGALLESNFLSRMQNLEILQFENTKDAQESRMRYVFEFGWLESEPNVLQKLREMTLCYLVNLESICYNCPLNGVFSNLQSLVIRDCRRLMYLFEYNVAESLLQLELLWVDECSHLGIHFVARSSTKSSNLVLPKLKEIYLNSLPELQFLSNRSNSVVCPVLEHLYVSNCPRLSNINGDRLASSDFLSEKYVGVGDEGHFAVLFERGEDSRRGIAFSIHHELQSRNVETFMDDLALETGKPISPGLESAIEESRLAIVVLSQNYASSSWCLKELKMIVECMEDQNMIVLPIFYGVDPSDVRHQKNSFADSLSSHGKRFDEEVVNGWRAALTKVADLKGFEAAKYGSDHELVRNIVETACSIVRPIDIEWTMCTGDFVEYEATRQATDKTMRALEDGKVTTIGVYGSGGVGKTSMVKHVAVQARNSGLFHHVIMAVMSQTPNLRNIQGTLADQLGLKLQEETEIGRAARIGERILRGCKILIILDDIWKTIDLSTIGIPYHEELQKCNSKILITTRRLPVCLSMESQTSIHLQVLSEDDAWDLFMKKAGQSFHESPKFYDVARTVAKECACLPLALVVVAKALRDKGLDDWTEAARRLKASKPATYDDESRKVFESIKLSYDYLRSDDDNIAKFFLLCCLFPEDFNIDVEDLLVYALASGLFQDAVTIKDARADAHLAVKYLKDSSLLLDSAISGFVKMHDVIRDVAISISLSEDGSRFLVKAGCGLKDWPAINIADKGYSAISLMRNDIRKLPTTLVCSELKILLIQSNNIDEIPNPFFQIPTELRVLDLSETSISFLPSSLSLLTDLQALYLDECKRIVDISMLGNLKSLQILSMKNFGGTRQKAFPKEIGHLTNLKILDITDACFKTVPFNVISNLNGLEELYMKCEFCDWGCCDLERRIVESTQSSNFTNFFFFLGVILLIIFGRRMVKSCLGSFLYSPYAGFDELTGLSRLNSLKVHIRDVTCLPQRVEFNPNWVNFNICISEKDHMFIKLQSYYGSFFERKLSVKIDTHRHHSRYLILNTSMKNLPNWFIDVVTEKAEIAEYTGYIGVENMVEEYHHGRLHEMKYLGVIECHVNGVLMKSITRFSYRPVFESLEELYLERVSGLEELCVGELPPGSLSNLKLLNVRNCLELRDGLLESNSLSRLQNLEILHCEHTFDAQKSRMRYVFRFGGLQSEQNVLPKLREMTLCYLVNLISICFDCPPHGVFRNLNTLAIRGCRNLRDLFEYNVAQSLLQLELLWVEECSHLETVITTSWYTESSNLVFPKLKEMFLNSLPYLVCISRSNSVVCPVLEHLYVYKCPRLSNMDGVRFAASDFLSENHVRVNDEGHFAVLFERLFHRQFNSEEFPQFFSKKESDFSLDSSLINEIDAHYRVESLSNEDHH